ncbi:hypothetical protein JKP88DRAFT_198715 [Tribonema minus]|uniref:Ankyrin repeat protein n=1 Tax=Tribonema minus TaxID=303371 RepID=A0A835YYW6_9STRA|nr:hypothetical protein JKP88DRAFT_198715 [Tribonema minus]
MLPALQWASDASSRLLGRVDSRCFVLSSALAGGNIELIEWAHQREQRFRSELNHSDYLPAARGGHVQALDWLWERAPLDIHWQQRPYCDSTSHQCVPQAAARADNVAALEWAVAHGWELCEHVVSTARDARSLGVLEWLLEHGAQWLVDAAANAGHMRTVQWLVEHGCAVGASDLGRLNMLQYAAARQTWAWDAEITLAAASVNRLDIVQFAVEYGCAIHAHVIIHAATFGALEMMQLAREQGSAWHKDVCWQACYAGHLNVLQYAVSHGCPWQLQQCLKHANMRRHQHILDYLRSGHVYRCFACSNENMFRSKKDLNRHRKTSHQA